MSLHRLEIRNATAFNVPRLVTKTGMLLMLLLTLSSWLAGTSQQSAAFKGSVAILSHWSGACKRNKTAALLREQVVVSEVVVGSRQDVVEQLER